MAHIAFACPSKRGVSSMPQPSYVHGAGATPLIGATQEQAIEDYSDYCSDCCWFDCCRLRRPFSKLVADQIHYGRRHERAPALVDA